MDILLQRTDNLGGQFIKSNVNNFYPVYTFDISTDKTRQFGN